MRETRDGNEYTERDKSCDGWIGVKEVRGPTEHEELLKRLNPPKGIRLIHPFPYRLTSLPFSLPFLVSFTCRLWSLPLKRRHPPPFYVPSRTVMGMIRSR